MQHLIFSKEPRRKERVKVNGRFWDIDAVTHHGGSQKYTLECHDPFAQGGYQRTFSAEVR